MAHGSSWTKDQVLFLIVLKLCSKHRWKQTAEILRQKFPGTTATAKDCESKFNKDLKKVVERDWIEKFKADAVIPQEEAGRRVIAQLVVWLGEMNAEDRVV
ncbi:hypothetical protein BGW36DRAFT_295160 [Talaromyces proteolyticus]|uniref:Myb-like domain-containing protein n=1 Tax=Talaromyces proteolyticus TaxID=1131652 RepID=A0AAD4KNN8_9EURO|nr:uncharacterized protein BGW36DRAFT_295160 [Talaromyces proteolyticus]KAH8697057.1 hypothetical protein BGW36DRAFT_295160 [Talaromyces proteolyticus]